MDTYFEVMSSGGIIEHSKELDSHRYVINRGETFDSVEELVEKIKKGQERARWVQNDTY